MIQYLKMAQYAAKSYTDSATMIVVNNTVAHLYEEDTTIIAIRGTDDCADWLQNLNRCKVPYVIDGVSYGSVHSGFLHELESIYPWLNNKIAEGRRIEIVGHSLGGAIAVLLGLYLSKTRSQHISVTTFGTPRIGNRRFHNMCTSPNLNIVRIYNFADVITHIPFIGYYHIGDPVRIYNTNTNVCKIGKNHSIYNYIEILHTHHI